MKSDLRLRKNGPIVPGIVLAALFLPGCILLSKRSVDLGPNMAPGDQPDKVLFEKAKGEIDHGRYDVGRLTLQTMINTYPDSEYLSKAKLLTADSYYKEGGVSGLTQAEAEYNDFITFFPTAPEAPVAKFRAGMSHFRLMGKPDRDLSEAKAAQEQFKEFLEKYPDSYLVPSVKGRLREVDEVLAQGNYETATLYFKHGVNRAAASRFQEIADSYPDFSQADQALWYLGECKERLRRPDEAASAYGRLLTYYPLSSNAGSAKERLVAMHKPVPKASKATLARARADRADQQRVHTSLTSKVMGEFTSAPDLSQTRHGPVLIGPQPASGAVAAQTQAPVNAQIAVEPLGGTSAPAATQPAAAQPAANPPANDPQAAAPPASNSSPAAGSGEKSGEPDAATGAPSSSGTASTETAPSADKTAPKAQPSDSDPPKATSSTKKKSKFHFLKKVVP
jgi:outer membrane protein assembly factor BamD